MKIKSLKEGPIAVGIRRYDYDFYYWRIDNPNDFGFAALTSNDNCDNKEEAKRNWERLAKLSGWENWKYV